MKKILSLLLILLLGVTYTSAKKEDVPFNYEIKASGTGQTGYYVVEVSTYVDNKSKINFNEIKKCAVHGVLFRGFSGDLAKREQTQKPILSPIAQKQHEDFFNSFFTGGQCYAYVTEVSPNIRTVKIGKEYKITAVVQVAKDQLRKDLEAAGIVKKLGL